MHFSISRLSTSQSTQNWKIVKKFSQLMCSTKKSMQCDSNGLIMYFIAKKENFEIVELKYIAIEDVNFLKL